MWFKIQICVIIFLFCEFREENEEVQTRQDSEA